MVRARDPDGVGLELLPEAAVCVDARGQIVAPDQLAGALLSPDGVLEVAAVLQASHGLLDRLATLDTLTYRAGCRLRLEVQPGAGAEEGRAGE